MSPAMEKGKKLRDILSVQPKVASTELRNKREKTNSETSNKENLKIVNNEDTIITPLIKEPRTPIGAERVKPKPVNDAVDFTAFYQRR